ncbi:unnamed protein product [Pedinophyceae sp. YPF-701]|nr:unnamed protein product [Pedinophyceae sp. YPF-701]
MEDPVQEPALSEAELPRAVAQALVVCGPSEPLSMDIGFHCSNPRPALNTCLTVANSDSGSQATPRQAAPPSPAAAALREPTARGTPAARSSLTESLRSNTGTPVAGNSGHNMSAIAALMAGPLRPPDAAQNRPMHTSFSEVLLAECAHHGGPQRLARKSPMRRSSTGDEPSAQPEPPAPAQPARQSPGGPAFFFQLGTPVTPTSEEGSCRGIGAAGPARVAGSQSTLPPVSESGALEESSSGVSQGTVSGAALLEELGLTSLLSTSPAERDPTVRRSLRAAAAAAATSAASMRRRCLLNTDSGCKYNGEGAEAEECPAEELRELALSQGADVEFCEPPAATGGLAPESDAAASRGARRLTRRSLTRRSPAVRARKASLPLGDDMPEVAGPVVPEQGGAADAGVQ